MKKIAISLLLQLCCEEVIKEILVKSLSKIVDRTKNAVDNDLLLTIKKAWGVE